MKGLDEIETADAKFDGEMYAGLLSIELLKTLLLTLTTNAEN